MAGVAHVVIDLHFHVPAFLTDLSALVAETKNACFFFPDF